LATGWWFDRWRRRRRCAAVGPGRFEKGERVPMELSVGQKVLYSKYAGTEVRIGNDELLIIKESDVLAIVE
jgi:chaperonin GroES